jgi:hypothetical protein
MANEGNSLALIESKERELADLYARMDKDRLLAYWGTTQGEKYKLKDDKENEIPRSISVTLNDAPVYAHSVNNATQAAIMQVRVEGLSDEQNGIIERFLEGNIEQADERRRKSLHNFISNQANLRGVVGCRWISYIEDGKYVPDCLPLDMRYCSYEEGNDGIWWYGYRTKRSKMAIKREYDIDIRSDTAEVIEYWDDVKNEVFIEKTLLKPKYPKPNPQGFPPVAIQKVDRGFMLQDEGYLAHEGESIFMLDRYLYDELNRIASIEATINLKLSHPGYQKETANPTTEPAPYPDKAGTVTEVPVNEKYSLLQVADINNSSRMIHSDIMRAIQNGSLSDIDYGNLSFPLSAVAISDMTDIKNKILIPTFQCLSLFYRQLYRLIIEQFRNGGYSGMPVGRIGNQYKYNVSDLGDPTEYTINLLFMSKTKRQEFANLSQAIAAKGTVPRGHIIREIMQAENPDEWETELDIERARELDPAYDLYCTASSMIRKADKEQDKFLEEQYRKGARILGERAVQIIRQRKVASIMNPQQDIQATAPQRGNAQPLISMFSQGASRTGGNQENNQERYRGSQV